MAWATNDSVQVDGLAELEQNLMMLREDVDKRIVRAALRLGGKIFADAMKAGVRRTVGALTHTSSGGARLRHLADDIRVKLTTKSGKLVAEIGAGKETAYIANFLEFGTAPHVITAKRAKDLFIPGRGFIKSVWHKGARQFRFIKPAFDTEWQTVIEKVKAVLAEGIARALQGRKAPSRLR